MQQGNIFCAGEGAESGFDEGFHVVGHGDAARLFVLPPFVFALERELVAAVGFAGSEKVAEHLDGIRVGHVDGMGAMVEIVLPCFIMMKIAAMMMNPGVAEAVVVHLAEPDGRADAVVPMDALPEFHAREFRPVVHDALPWDARDASEVEDPVFVAQDHPGVAEQAAPERHALISSQSFLGTVLHVLFHGIDHIIASLASSNNLQFL